MFIFKNNKIEYFKIIHTIPNQNLKLNSNEYERMNVTYYSIIPIKSQYKKYHIKKSIYYDKRLIVKLYLISAFKNINFSLKKKKINFL